LGVLFHILGMNCEHRDAFLSTVCVAWREETRRKTHLLPPGAEAAMRAADVEHGIVQARGAHAVAEEITGVSAAVLLLDTAARRRALAVRARLRQERAAAAAMVRRWGLTPSTSTQRRHAVVTMRRR